MSLSQELRLSFVPRWTVVPMNRSQTVSDHSWRTAMIAKYLASQVLDPSRRSTVWMIATRALIHDVEEAKTGDIPSTMKGTPDFKSMPAEELLVKVADYLESYSWAFCWAHPQYRAKVLAHIEPRLTEAISVLNSQCPDARHEAELILKELTSDSL